MGADLRRCDLAGANLDHAILVDANLRSASLPGADLTKALFRNTAFFNADLSGAHFGQGDWLEGLGFNDANMAGAHMNQVVGRDASFDGATLTGVELRGASLVGASFVKTNLSSADLTGADLSRARLVDTTLEAARLDGCRVYGVAVWQARLDGAHQHDLVVTPNDTPPVTVDDLELAQFVYLLLNNRSVRRVIDAITSKVVLIVGSFSSERKAILDTLRAALREANYTPILFDFEKPANRDMTETVSTLAHMARFVIADLTDAKSVRQELERVVPDLPSVPVQPLLMTGDVEFAMFDHVRRYPWVLEPVRYESQDALIASLGTTLIPNVEAAVKRLRR